MTIPHTGRAGQQQAITPVLLVAQQNVQTVTIQHGLVQQGGAQQNG